MPPVTRSQTAALRAATAESDARNRAVNAENERLRLLRAREARIAASFPRRGPNDVVANFTDSTRASIAAAQTTRITENLEEEIQRIRNAANNIPPPVLGTGRARSSRIDARRRQIIEARQIMDVNVSSLYNISQDIYAYLNVDQMLYFTRNSITENYYYRKLELAYGIPTIDKLNQICQNIIDNIPSNSDISTLPYRYDIDYYCQIVNFLEQINLQYVLVNNKQEIKRTLISELTTSINNEKLTITNLIIHLSNVRDDINPSQNILISAINETIAKLTDRRAKLYSITTTIIAKHFDDKAFDEIRKHTLIILQAAITLCKIFLLLIIKLYNFKIIL